MSLASRLAASKSTSDAHAQYTGLAEGERDANGNLLTTGAPNVFSNDEYNAIGPGGNAGPESAEQILAGAPLQANPGLAQHENYVGATWGAPDTFTNIIGAIVAGGLTAGVGSALGGGVVGAIGQGAAQGAVGSVLEGKPVLKGAAQGAETGAISAAIGGASKLFGKGLTDAGVPAGIEKVGVGAGAGALKSAITGGNPLTGAISGAITGGIDASGVKGAVEGVAGKVPGDLALGLAGGAISGLASNALSSSGHSAGVPPSSTPGGAMANDPFSIPNATSSQGSGGFMGDDGVYHNPQPGGTSTSAPSGLLGGIESGLGIDPNNVLGSIGSDLGSALPYAAVAGIGLAQAKSGQAQDQKYAAQEEALGQPAITESNALLKQYQSGTLNAADQKVVNTEQQQGQALIDSTAGLSKIAQQAFADYSAGKLPPADELKLQQQTQAQKQQVRQQLASAGITDSTILAGQDQQIDNQAQITRQSLLDARFATGNTAYDEWLKGTTQGQQTIVDGQKFASSQLDSMLKNSMSELALGIGPVEAGIQNAMATDAKYADEVSQLLGTLTTAYAYQMAKKSAGQPQGTAQGQSAGSKVGQAAGGAAAGAAGKFFQGTAPDQNSLGNYLTGSQPGFDNSVSDSMNSGLDDFFGGQDSPVGGWLNTSGEGTLGDIDMVSWGDT